jgi:hypothetical protein
MVAVAAADLKDMQAYVLGFLVFAAATLLAGWRLWRIVRLRVFGQTATVVRTGTGWAEFEVPGQGSFVCDRSRYARRTDRHGKLQVVYYTRNPRVCADRDEVPGLLTASVVIVFMVGTTSLCGLMIAGMAG